MEKKWEGKVSTFLQNTKTNKIWPQFKDFFNIHKYLSSLSNSYGIHGTNGEVGCIRFCLGSSIPPTNNISGVKEVSWTKERLIAVNEENMSLSYEIVESNIGFNSYVSTVRITPAPRDDDHDDDGGCLIEWSFTVDPVQGLRFQDLVDKYQLALQRMAKAIEDSQIIS